MLDTRRRRRLPVGLFQSADDTVLESRGTRAKKGALVEASVEFTAQPPPNARAEAYRSTRASSAAAAGPTPVALISNV